MTTHACTLHLLVAFSVFCVLSPFEAAAAPDVPIVSINPPSVAYNQQILGSTGTAEIMIQNTAPLGGPVLHISSISIDNPIFVLLPLNLNCQTGVLAQDICFLGITFSPTVAGSYTGTMTITDDAADSPQLVPITATATGISIQPTKLKFKQVTPGTVSAPQTATLLNTGSVPITITDVGFTGNGAPGYLIQNNACSVTLNPGENCAVQVAFAPQGEGKEQAELTVTDSDPESPQQIDVHGDGTNVQIEPSALHFGSIKLYDITKPLKVKVTNTGTGAIAFTSVTTDTFGIIPQSFPIYQNDCTGTLAPGASCGVAVQFGASALGVSTGQLILTDSDAGSPQTIALFGGAYK